MTVAQVLFYLLAFVASVAALVVVLSRNVIYSAVFLAFSLLGVAGIFLLLLADFLALVQVLLYAGAVIILVVFALMLTRQEGSVRTLDNPQKPLAALAALVFLGALLYGTFSTPWPAKVGETLEYVPYTQVGETLFTQWPIPFEVASLVLLVALVGAVVIARAEERERR